MPHRIDVMLDVEIQSYLRAKAAQEKREQQQHQAHELDTALLHRPLSTEGTSDLSIQGICADYVTGSVKVIQIGDEFAIGLAEIQWMPIQKGDLILFKTRNSSLEWIEDTCHEMIYLEWEAADFLVQKGVRTIGLDYLTVWSINEGTISHQHLLKSGVCLLEGLSLIGIDPGPYQMECMPLAEGEWNPLSAKLILTR